MQKRPHSLSSLNTRGPLYFGHNAHRRALGTSRPAPPFAASCFEKQHELVLRRRASFALQGPVLGLRPCQFKTLGDASADITDFTHSMLIVMPYRIVIPGARNDRLLKGSKTHNVASLINQQVQLGCKYFFEATASLGTLSAAENCPAHIFHVADATCTHWGRRSFPSFSRQPDQHQQQGRHVTSSIEVI